MMMAATFIGKTHLAEILLPFFMITDTSTLLAPKSCPGFEAVAPCCHCSISALGHLPLNTFISTNSNCFCFFHHPFSWLLQIFSNISVISKVWLASKATPSAYLTNMLLMPFSWSLKVMLNKNNLKTDSSAIFFSYNLTVWCLHCLPSFSQFSGQLWCSYPVLLRWFSSGQFIFSTAEN